MSVKLQITVLSVVLLPFLLEGQTIVSSAGEQWALSLPTNVETYYQVRRSNDLRNLTETPDVIELVGTGEEIAPLLPTNAERAFYQIATEPLTAIASNAIASTLSGQTVLGVNFTSNQRWDSFGFTGSWSYEITSSSEGLLTLTFDEFNNDSDLAADTFALDFGSDGSLSTLGYLYTFDGDTIETETGELDLSQDSFAPTEIIFPKLLIGNTYFDYRFLSENRFVFGGDEFGNYFWSRPNDDQIRIILTYDEDGNTPLIYREEFLLTFGGSTSVSVLFELYESDSLSASQNVGNITLLAD